MHTKIKIFITPVMVLIMNAANIVSAETVNYTYDTMQRIIRAQYSSGPAIEYVYDIMGNRTVRSVYAGGVPVNSPPNPAAVPSPVVNAVGIASPLTLSWSGSDPNPGDRLSYTVHAGTVSTALTPVWSGSQNSFMPWMLPANTPYYWKVVTRDSHNAETAGPLWTFKTGGAPVNGLPVNLDVSLAGTGSGSVTSTNPAGIVCAGSLSDACAGDFTLNTSVTLYAVAGNSSRFNGWSVASCPPVQSYTPPFMPVPPPSCTVAMTGDMAVAATFDSIPPIRLVLSYAPGFDFPYEMDSFATAAGMLQSLGTNATYPMSLQTHNRLFTENFDFNSGTQNVLWQGGYSGDYSSVTGTTRIQGILTIQGGTLIVDRIVIM